MNFVCVQSADEALMAVAPGTSNLTSEQLLEQTMHTNWQDKHGWQPWYNYNSLSLIWLKIYYTVPHTIRPEVQTWE